MISLESDIWKTLLGGYKIVYDPSAPLKQLEASEKIDESIWDELWNELHHQGDVGEASYAVIPHLFRIYSEKSWIDFNLPSFAAVVEYCRLKGNNPDVPSWLEHDYYSALQDIAQYCVANRERNKGKDFTRSVLLLMSILLAEVELYELIDIISIGDEKKTLELYENS
jgi:hypothetical protein